MQISVKIMIRFDAGAERINIVRAFGWILPLCFILFDIIMCKVGSTEKPTKEQTSEIWIAGNRRTRNHKFIRFVIPVVFNKLIRVECMFLSNTSSSSSSGAELP